MRPEEIPDVLRECAAALYQWIDTTHPWRVQAEQHLEYIRLAEAGLRTLIPQPIPPEGDEST